jgi:uncharacterized protein YrzB (UPF0473 family)
MNDKYRDLITIKDENGHERELSIEALFDMDEKSYALLKENNETFLMRVKNEGNEQYLIGITDPFEKESILDAYEIALGATLEENEDHS